MAYNKLILIYVIIAICAYYGALAEKMMRPKFKDAKFWSDEKYLTHKATFDAADPHLNFTMEVFQPLQDVDIHIEARITNKLDAYYNSNINSTLSLCRILGYTTKSPVGRFVHGIIREYGNIIESCPIAKGSYYANKIWWPEDSTTSMLPEIDFEINFSAYLLDANKKRTMIINDHIMGEFIVQEVNNLKPGIFAMLPKGR